MTHASDVISAHSGSRDDVIVCQRKRLKSLQSWHVSCACFHTETDGGVNMYIVLIYHSNSFPLRWNYFAANVQPSRGDFRLTIYSVLLYIPTHNGNERRPSLISVGGNGRVVPIGPRSYSATSERRKWPSGAPIELPHTCFCPSVQMSYINQNRSTIRPSPLLQIVAKNSIYVGGH
jgi:hypothetical protein